MRLSELLSSFIPVEAEIDREIQGLSSDSRRINTNFLFFALKGHQSDGSQFIAQAIQKGAIAILVESTSPNDRLTWQDNVPLIPIVDLSTQLGEIAARFYDYPAKKMYMMGVTGTNGKTSCTHFIAQVLQSINIPCGVIGTLGSGLYGQLGEPGLTTPDAITLQALLNDLYQAGAQAIAMEVSSHSIDQGRINGIEFDLGIFTNLTQDHLDYHGTMQNYAAVKRRFLAELPIKQLIINADDEYGRQFINELKTEKSVIAYSTQEKSSDDLPAIHAQHIALSLEGIRANVSTPWGEGELVLPLIGQFNLSNALAVLTTVCSYGIPLPQALKAMTQLQPVPGRMQTVNVPQQPLVVVDYAHTPDALEKVLQALRAHTKGKLICVFGCGGDRDQGKRPLMAQIAESLADKVIVTNDNPRHESPDEIARQIMQGFTQPTQIHLILDRSKAIENSIQWASSHDCVLIAGKGAERYQQIGDEKIPFDDVKTVLTKFGTVS